jgi:hypothetical protein
MRKEIKLILGPACFILLLTACNRSFAPSAYKYNIHDVQRQISGCWTDVKIISAKSFQGEIFVSGELIAIESDTMYLLSLYKLESICLDSVNEVILRMYQNRAGKFALATSLLFASNIVGAVIHDSGGFLLIGIPGLMTGTIISLIESSKSNLRCSNKYDISDLKKFARFPQGMPQGIDKSRLHLVFKQ